MSYRSWLFSALAAAVLSLMAAFPAQAQYTVGDREIDGSLCVGLDCVNGESFSFDTIRMKENNLRVKFMDTSSSASFPQNDWQLRANESSNGGRNAFFIDDMGTANTNGQIPESTPFTIEANAGTNALYIDDGERIGFGTSSPAVNLHVVEGNTPTLRLAQDGSSGFTPQTFDVAANETNFFIRDATNGSTLPFRIRPGSPSDAIVIAGTVGSGDPGDVGIGTSSPSSALHVRRTGNVSTGLRLEQNGTTSASWEILNNEATGRLTFSAGATVPFKFAPTAVENLLRVGIDANDIVDINGALDVSGAITSASITTSGSCSVGCDAVFEADYDLPSIAEHTEAMWSLGYLPNVGPTFDGQQIDVADKLGRVLNELEHAHIYIAQQQDEISLQKDMIVNLQERLSALEVQ